MKVLELHCDRYTCDARIGAVAGPEAERQLTILAQHKGWTECGGMHYCNTHSNDELGQTLRRAVGHGRCIEVNASNRS